MEPLLPRWHMLPDKVPGVHRWIAVITYALNGASLKVGGEVVTDPENMLNAEFGCIDCQGPFELVAEQPCRAAAFSSSEG